MAEAEWGGHWPIVGRDAEARAVGKALEDPASGGVALIGGPGFGKTRLARLATELAHQGGLPSITLRSTKSSRHVPLGVLSPLFSELGIALTGQPSIARATIEAINARRGRHRLVLVIDDVHELDEMSLAVLDQLVVQRSVFVVFTARAGEPRSDLIVGMWKDQHILRIEVGELPPRDLRALAVIAIGGPVDGATLQTLVEASAGNVLFLRELIHAAIESAALVCSLGISRLEGSLARSPRLRDLIEQRLLGLGPKEREALELVALAEPVSLPLVERLVPLDVIERLESRQLVDVLFRTSVAQLRLNHPLYGEVVRAHLPAVKRLRLSRCLADAAERGGSIAERDVLRVAIWRLDGGGRGPLATTLAAANQALGVEDYSLALRLGEAAWSWGSSVEAALVVGGCLDYLGRSEEAVDVLAAAAALGNLSDHERTRLAVRRASALFRSLDRGEEADRIIEQAAELVVEESCRRELTALRGNHLLLAGEVAAAVEIGQDLIKVGDDAAFAQASLDVATGLALAGRTQEALEHAAQGIAVRNDLDDPKQLSAIGVYLVAQALALFHSGDLQRASEICEAGYQVALEKKNLDGQAWFACMLALTRLSQGRVRTAVNLFREVAAAFRALGHPGQRWGLGGIALASSHAGDLASAESALRELDTVGDSAVRLQDVAIMRARAWTALLEGRISDARHTLVGSVEYANRCGQYAAASEALHDLLRMGVSQPTETQLDEIAGRVDGRMMTARLTLSRALAHSDERQAELAADQFEDMGACLFAAEAAAMEHTFAEAAGLRRRASAAAGRIDRLLSVCEGASPPWLTEDREVATLSDREREVALLAARRMSSKQISEKLFLSSRTVDNHLQRAYSKLGIHSRKELAETMISPHTDDHRLLDG